MVEDDADARDLLELVLSEAGAHVTLVGSVPEAMAALAAMAPGVIVSDIGLPGEDGYSFLQRVRASPEGTIAATPAVAITAFNQPEDRRKATDAGFNAHVAKPFDPACVVATVARLVAVEA